MPRATASVTSLTTVSTEPSSSARSAAGIAGPRSRPAGFNPVNGAPSPARCMRTSVSKKWRSASSRACGPSLRTDMAWSKACVISASSSARAPTAAPGSHCRSRALFSPASLPVRPRRRNGRPPTPATTRCRRSPAIAQGNRQRDHPAREIGPAICRRHTKSRRAQPSPRGNADQFSARQPGCSQCLAQASSAMVSAIALIVPRSGFMPGSKKYIVDQPPQFRWARTRTSRMSNNANAPLQQSDASCSSASGS